eukprot:CAMPEP_0116126842 /NCGR_PEP_ID=MMETSP0329-20121206/6537_1 /TAXON_ID=697910 /ORGANISM="Pseudo-nitzschia arenysensis, Strain B593" /LENGTH=845 /DNA_ID=CAMNT_0003620931 /DNA_START=1377 /DNA_END=3914 /DNA_ORIENTATION=+
MKPYFSMAPPITIPCVDEDKEDSDPGIDNTFAFRKTTRRPTTSNRIPSPFRDRNEVTNKNRSSMLVGPTMMALESQSRLRMSRQGILHSSQSRDGNESPSNKFSRLEKKYEELPPSTTYGRAISSNHDCSKPRNKKFEDRISDDTYSHNSTVTELTEIPSYSSPAATNGGKTERTFDRAQSACSDGDLPCRNPPMKSAKIARPNMADLLIIRIPTPLQTQITASKQKPLTLTGTNHITQNNTANFSSTKTGNQKNNSSMAVLQCSNAIASSSTTESSPSSTSSAKASPSKATSSENMNAAGSVVENAQSHIQSEKDNISTSLTPKGICKPQSPSLTTKTIRKLIQPKTLIVEKESEKGKVSQQLVAETKEKTTGVNSTANTIVKERVETPQKTETSAMSIIKSSVVQQALSSASATFFSGIQVKSVSTGPSNVNKNLISGQSTTATATTTKKKKTSSGSKRKRTGSNGSSSSQKPKGQSSGRWTQEEHQAFLEGLTECGREWKKVALRIPTRTSAQIRSHAQKYFAKLQRDQESSAANVNVGYVHGDLSTPLTPVGPGLVVGVGGLSGTIIMSPGAAQIAPSVRRNVERIVSNPRAAQREVEDTMEALRERYRQLQQRLEERRRNREEHKKKREQKQQQQLSSASTNTGASSDVSTIASPPTLLQKTKLLNSASRKRLHLPINQQKENIKKLDASGRSTSSPTGDDGSSVCSNVSSIAASRTDLGNEEIIALQVLGDALPRGDSANDLHVLGAEVFQGRGDSSIEADGTMPLMNDNISSSSYDQLAPLPGVANDNDSMMNQGDSITENEINLSNGADASNSGSLSVGGISAMDDPGTIATNATTT